MNFNFIIVIFCVLCSYSIVGVRGGPKTCLGPTKFYKELGCQPLYKREKSTCPYQYRCKSMKNRNSDVCYLKGVEYSVGSSVSVVNGMLTSECKCTKHTPNATAQFVCDRLDCSLPPPPGCYRTRDSVENRYSPVKCFERPGIKTTCRVDGKVYKLGEYFEPASEPGKRCYCGTGYTENDADKVIKNNGLTKMGVKCRFGNISMEFGDELSVGSDILSKCVTCSCLVGPVLSCQRRLEDQCQPDSILIGDAEILVSK
ncbi:uncharacterized protein LOC107048014 [Diachasma alloeum]|uniref:uncharacterized protein LOC107048014 n=1 Tax=Diachasma alloeum TaxID=454923 RepID=UPI00073823B1|nr:uncharacterized protein LOC107048014 [Diachasma alloeum]